MSWKSSRIPLVVIALCAAGAFACKYENNPNPGEKTTVGRDNHAGGGWTSNGGVGGGPPPTANAPNASGSAVPGDDMTKENPNDVPGHGRGAPASSASSSTSSAPGGIESQGTSPHNGPHTNGPMVQNGGVMRSTREGK